VFGCSGCGCGGISDKRCGVGGRARAFSVDQTVGTGRGAITSVHHTVGGRMRCVGGWTQALVE
jgi:hypothetical protein